MIFFLQSMRSEFRWVYKLLSGAFSKVLLHALKGLDLAALCEKQTKLPIHVGNCCLVYLAV